MARVAADAATGRKEQIVAVATRLFSERGYAQTSLDDVAAEIGFTKPAIYYWFKSKDDILFAIHDRIVGEAMARVRAIRKSEGPARQQLRAVLAQHVTMITGVNKDCIFGNAGILERLHYFTNRFVERKT